jgi:hypothetical protein
LAASELGATRMVDSCTRVPRCACAKARVEKNSRQMRKIPNSGNGNLDVVGGTPPPLRSIGIIGLAENLEKIQGLQSVRAKILGTKELAASLWASSMRVLMHSESAFRVVEVKVI